MAASPELSVLMVCMGNICRSPTAEGVLRRKLAAAGLSQRVAVDSAGTHGYHVGAPPDERSQQHALRRGYDLSTQRARRLVVQDLQRFDLVLVMDEDNLQEVQGLAVEAGAPGRAAVHKLLHFAGHSRADVPDPYYSGAAGFEQVLDLVEAACDGLVNHLAQRLRA
ncbi:protein-tyrosine-phosphatase [Burkholderiales bacterium JOSHI_001]|nr:protein-tyrosine-phosphatase [Burkholderiales bacterium JOSHI_001]